MPRPPAPPAPVRRAACRRSGRTRRHAHRGRRAACARRTGRAGPQARRAGEAGLHLGQQCGNVGIAEQVCDRGQHAGAVEHGRHLAPAAGQSVAEGVHQAFRRRAMRVGGDEELRRRAETHERPAILDRADADPPAIVSPPPPATITPDRNPKRCAISGRTCPVGWVPSTRRGSSAGRCRQRRLRAGSSRGAPDRASQVPAASEGSEACSPVRHSRT